MSVSDTDMTSDIAIKADSPVRTKEEDLLDRAGMAARVAEFINRSCGAENPCDESLVVGIEGEWGSGKTSFINLILENLKPEEPELPEFLIIEFNPWNFSDQNELITDFFQSIIVGLESEKTMGGNDFEIDTAARKIKRYFPKLLERSNVNFGIPGVLSVGLDLEGMTGDPLERRKKEINGLLARIGKPIVIVIDDIDRLDARETRLVFKLVRMTANFANTVFLLAYDRGKVGELISEKGIIKGEEFLKKIVQLSFPLPRPDQRSLFRILFKELGGAMESFDSESWGWESWEDFFDPDLEGDYVHTDDLRRRWRDLFDSSLKKLFPTVRDVRRYVNGLRLDLEIMPAYEVNPVDFLGMEAIRIFAPDVYFAMADEKSVLAFPAGDKIYEGEEFLEYFVEPEGQDEETRRKKYEEIIKRSPGELTETVGEAVKLLFPQVKDLYRESGQTYGDHDHKSWRMELRVCSGAIFDKYFSLFVTSGVLSERDLGDFLEATGDPSAGAKILKRLRTNGKLYMLLERLSDHAGELSARCRENLLVIVLDFMEDVTDRGPLCGLRIMERNTTGLCYRVLKSIPGGKGLEIAEKTLGSTKGVFSPAYLLGGLNQAVEEFKKGTSREEPPFAREEMRRLNDICVGEIEKAAEDGSLADNKRLHYVLSYWKKWGPEAAAGTYVAELSQTSDGLISLLRGFASGDEGIHKDLLEEFIDLGELDRKVSELDGSSSEQSDIKHLWNKPSIL